MATSFYWVVRQHLHERLWNVTVPSAGLRGGKLAGSPGKQCPWAGREAGGWPRRNLSFLLGVIFLYIFFQVRTRGSIKRRPPSRRFRKSQSEYGELGDFRAPESSQENGAQEEAGDEVFQSRNKAPGSPQSSEEAGRDGSRNLETHERPPLRRTDKQEGEVPAPEKATPEQLPEKAAPDAQEEATPPPKGPSTEAPGSEAESGCGSPEEARPATEQREEAPEQREEAAAAKVERASRAGEPAQQSLDTHQLEEKSGGQESPQSPPEGVEGSLTPAEGTDKEKQEEGGVLEPGCHPRTSNKMSEKEVGGSASESS